MRNSKVIYGVIFFCSFIFFNASLASAKFINTFLLKIGGDNFPNSDATAKYLAQYDLIITRKMESRDIGGSYGSTWKAIKSHNPNTEIHLYTQVNTTHPSSDSSAIYYLNNLSRYLVSRGHPAGNLDDHENFFLHRNGKRLEYSFNGQFMGYWLDPGASNFPSYTLVAALNDHKNQPWAADGVYTDILPSQLSQIAPTDEYATQNAWSTAVKSLINYLSKGLHAQDQAFSVHHGPTRLSEVKAHWKTLNAIANPPKFLLEEAAHAFLYGPGDINFLSEYKWKNQIDTMAALTNIGYLAAASTILSTIDATGTDNYGNNFTAWDALYFSMGSFCLGKDDEDAFFFRTANPSPNYGKFDHYHDEYDLIDLGAAMGSYKVTQVSGSNIYYREFSKGYVYVNPNNTNVNSISLPVNCKQRTHDNLYNNIDSLPEKTSINLNAHRAAFLFKSDSSVPPPTKLQIIN